MRDCFRIAVRQFEPFESAIRKQWADFSRQHGSGLGLEVVPMDLHTLHHALFEDEALRSGGFDLAFINTDWLAQADRQNALVDLTPLLHHDPPQDYPGGWSPSLLRLQSMNGRILGVPYHDGPETLSFRSDLFGDSKEQGAYARLHGKELRPPESWEEFHQIARFFQRPQKGLYGAVFAAFPDGHNTVYDFLLQLWTRGGELFDSQGRLTLITPQAEAALAFYRAMLQDRSATHPECHHFDSVRAGMAFAKGEVAMMVNWFGFAAMAQTISESAVKGCVDLAPIPHCAGAASTSLNIYWLLCIPTGSPRPDCSYAFLRHCMSQEMDKLLTLEGGVGCRRSTWNDPEVNSIIPFFHRAEEIHRNARELPALEIWPLIASLVDELVVRVIQAQQPIPELLKEAQANASRLGLDRIHCG
ncbi:MAG: extracellular solute-binding protein [Terracidiphilus sp.]